MQHLFRWPAPTRQTITFFTARPGSTTLPLLVFGMVKTHITPEINALSTIWVLTVFILLLLSQMLQRRSAASQTPAVEAAWAWDDLGAFSVRNEREPQMTSSARVAYPTVAICVALLMVACAPAQDADDTTPEVSPTASLTRDEPSASPASIVRPLRDTGGTGILDPGTYVLDAFPVSLAFDIPDGDPPGWHVGKSQPDAAVVLWYTPPDITYGFSFWNVDNVYADPCDAAVGELEPPIGPSVDDLVAALSNLPGFRATAPIDVTVGAFRGKEIELTALESESDCPQLLAWSAGDESTDLAPGDAIRVQVLDADGVRIVSMPIEPSQPDAAVEAELHQILDSIRIEPAS